MAGFPTFTIVEEHPIEDTILGFAEGLEYLRE